ncbi:hypothetical protein H7J93_27770 [Mycobacterium barrassiae]|uniref:hypothetical protein n=1 Tax=Mycobacterium barrassiae TaxID=319709 RepID=UPI0022658474|nr:hypothetical protein [Mycobacterium barrassiae]MCV7303422.1 hypothetical protein [Mycobacterium barrassiae]
MQDSRGVRRARGVAVAVASVVAVGSTAMGVAAFPALAQPVDETTVVETPYVPTEEAVPEAPPVVEVPPPVIEIPTAAPPVVPQAPVQTPVPVQTQAPVVTEAPVETQAPVVTTTAAPPVTAESEPTSAAPATTEAVTTATTAATTDATTSGATTSGATTTPSGSTALETSTSAPSGTSTTATVASTSASEATASEESTSGETTTATTEQIGGTTVEDSGSIEQAAGVTTTPEPQRVEALPEDVERAMNAKPVEEVPPPAPPAEIDKLRNLILAPDGSTDGASTPTSASLAAAEQKVMQWQPDWVQYDKYYRPLIFNPYPEPLQLVYDVGGVPRTLLIEPFGRVVTEVRDLGSYNFTALRLNVLGIPIDIAVGNFFGGGYLPAPGQPPPPPPPPVRTLNDVPVQVKYTDATYRPIVVRRVVDVGPDPSQGGAHKVLLDGVTPAWGEWKQNEQGVPQFEVHQTQSFPGMEAPAEGPLPGNYDLQLVSDSTPTGLSGKDITFIVAAVIAAAVGIGAIALTVFRGKRRRPQH